MALCCRLRSTLTIRGACNIPAARPKTDLGAASLLVASSHCNRTAVVPNAISALVGFGVSLKRTRAAPNRPPAENDVRLHGSARVTKKLIVVLAIMATMAACHRHANTSPETHWVLTSQGTRTVTPDPTAPAIPVTVHFCGAFRQKLEIDQHNVVTLSSNSDRWHGKISVEQLNELQGVLLSDDYTAALREAREEGVGIVCVDESEFVIVHVARHLKYRFAVDVPPGLPEAVASLVRIVDAMALEQFGSAYSPILAEPSVNPNPRLNLTVRPATALA